MQLARVIVFTSDVRRITDFYSSVFGLSMVGEFDSGWTELDAGGCRIAFHGLPFEVTGGPDEAFKLVFGTTDVAGERARLEGLGIEMTEIYRWQDIEFCDGIDPDGHRFQISSRGEH